MHCNRAGQPLCGKLLHPQCEADTREAPFTEAQPCARGRVSMSTSNPFQAGWLWLSLVFEGRPQGPQVLAKAKRWTAWRTGRTQALSVCLHRKPRGPHVSCYSFWELQAGCRNEVFGDAQSSSDIQDNNKGRSGPLVPAASCAHSADAWMVFPVPSAWPPEAERLGVASSGNPPRVPLESSVDGNGFHTLTGCYFSSCLCLLKAHTLCCCCSLFKSLATNEIRSGHISSHSEGNFRLP